MAAQAQAAGEHLDVTRLVRALQGQELLHLAVVWMDLAEVILRLMPPPRAVFGINTA